MPKQKSIKLLGPSLPRKVYLACSGGVDSMFALSFLLKGNKEVTLAFFHHGTRTSSAALTFLTEIAQKHNINLLTSSLSMDKPKGASQEEYWRNERYKFFHGLEGPVVMAHHLDDCVETWLFGAIHGNPKVIPYRNRNVVRPFLLARKDFIISWCERNKVPWIDDKSNLDVKYMRNMVRHNIVPEALKVNPGIHKVVARKVLEQELSA